MRNIEISFTDGKGRRRLVRIPEDDNETRLESIFIDRQKDEVALTQRTTTFRERVIEEKKELSDKYRKLHEFMASETFKTLPIEEQDRLSRQQLVMLQYNDILGERIAAF